MNLSSRGEAENILRQVYEENPKLWPAGVSVGMFDAGCYLIREKRAGTAVGVVGFQRRHEYLPSGIPQTIGYYSIAVLPEHRQQGYAKEAVAKVLREKSSTVDQVRALIVAGNSPSIALAHSLKVPAIIKQAMSRWSEPLDYYKNPAINEALTPLARQKLQVWTKNKQQADQRLLPLPLSYRIPMMFQHMWGRSPQQDLKAELAGSRGQGVFNQFQTQTLPQVQLS